MMDSSRVPWNKDRTAADDKATALALWTEEVLLEQGTLRYPIRVVAVDDLFRTRFDRLVKLPKDSTTYIYRVLDHGIPWQHLEAGLALEDVRQQLVKLSRGKRLVLYDISKTISLFNFSEEQLSQLEIVDIRQDKKSLSSSGTPLSYWDLVLNNLGHHYTGKPANYDAIELTDFLMSIYLKYGNSDQSRSTPDQLQIPRAHTGI